jgi:hypothetical protein
MRKARNSRKDPMYLVAAKKMVGRRAKPVRSQEHAFTFQPSDERCAQARQSNSVEMLAAFPLAR